RSVEAQFGLNRHMRADKGDGNRRIRIFNHLSQSHIAFKTRCRGKESEEFIIFGNRDGFFWAKTMRRRIDQPAVFDQAGRIGQPDWIPVGWNFSGGWISRTSTAIEPHEGRGIKQQGFHLSLLCADPSESALRVARVLTISCWMTEALIAD